MKRLNILFTLVLAALCTGVLSSCKKDIPDPLSLSVTPGYLVMNVTGGTEVQFTISGQGPKNLSRFKMEVQDNSNTKTVLLDSALTWGSKFSLLYTYTIPNRSTAFTTVLYFYLLDSEGNVVQTSRTLNASATSTPVTERSGLKLASKHSTNADAYDLLNLSSLMSDLDDAGLQDIVDVPNVSDAATLSHSWKSGNGAKFLLFNSFNYGSATQETIRDAYESGTAVSQVNGLSAGSVVLIQTLRDGLKHYYAVQITSINEDTVGDNDFYLFSVKY